MKHDQAFRIYHDENGHRAGLESQPRPEPGEGEVLIQVTHSSVNYKDALAGTGRGKILRTFPLIGGIDAAGEVLSSQHPAYDAGDAVIATGWGLSFDHDGGYARYLCVPGDWLVPMPEGLDARSAMIFGTAGFTAGLAAHRMLLNGQHPDMGPILINGASGGVGSIAIALFARLGFEVVAISGKPQFASWLSGLGASNVIGRDALSEAKRPLEKAQWGGAVDSVGGEMLAQITRTIAPGGNIAAIGLAGGIELNTSVMPFILRGIGLFGCNSVDVPYPVRREIWQHLASDWRPRDLESLLTETVGLSDLPKTFERLLDGQAHGRILVELD